jgi:hypothetical protein
MPQYSPGNHEVLWCSDFQFFAKGGTGFWNYTLRADAAFGTNIDIGKSTNDVEIYQIPLQHAVDAAIATVNSTGDAVALPPRIDEYRMYLTLLRPCQANVTQPLHLRRRRNGWTVSPQTSRM